MRTLVGAIALFLSLNAAVEAAGATRPHARARRPRPMRVTATAYCQDGRTQSGVRTHTGIVAADPRVLPVGSVVRIVDGPTTGVYTVMDTGPAIKGRRIDVYVPSCDRAKRFGRRSVSLVVVRRGWNPATGGARSAPTER